MIRLYVNVDHVATLREARKTVEPDPLKAAELAIKAGAYGITIHLREDRRHIQDHDVERIRKRITVPLNLEMAAVNEMVQIAIKTRPRQVSLVPEKRQELTTEGGLDVVSQEGHLAAIKERLKHHCIQFSLFIDPDSRQIKAANHVGADSIELNTARYSETFGTIEGNAELIKIQESARQAAEAGLKVFAGHGLNTENVVDIASISQIEELNIGHSIVGHAVYEGFEKAVDNMILSIKKGTAMRLG